MDPEQIEVRDRDLHLKRLGFVRLIAISALACVSKLYDYAKQHSGPLKSVVGAAESAVTTIAGPVYDTFSDVPVNILVFVDEKADELVSKLDELAPPCAKRIVIKTKSIIQKASQVALTSQGELQVRPPSTAIHCAVNSCLQMFLRLLASIWYLINSQFTSVHVLAQMILPNLTHWSTKYNETILDLSAKGYIGFRCFPKVPIDGLAKAYKQLEAEKGPACPVCTETKPHMD